MYGHIWTYMHLRYAILTKSDSYSYREVVLITQYVIALKATNHKKKNLYTTYSRDNWLIPSTTLFSWLSKHWLVGGGNLLLPLSSFQHCGRWTNVYHGHILNSKLQIWSRDGPEVDKCFHLLYDYAFVIWLWLNNTFYLKTLLSNIEALSGMVSFSWLVLTELSKLFTSNVLM